jgi:hypothetical protein
VKILVWQWRDNTSTLKDTSTSFAMVLRWIFFSGGTAAMSPYILARFSLLKVVNINSRNSMPKTLKIVHEYKHDTLRNLLKIVFFINLGN